MSVKKKIQVYRDKFSETRFWKFIGQKSRALSQGTVYSALLLFYAYKKKETPGWAKRIVLGTLGYLLMPLDAVPDLSPLIGFTDDVGILSFGLVTIAAYIDQDVRNTARNRMVKWFDHLEEDTLAKVDSKL